MATTSTAKALGGGAWLLQASDPASVFTPDQLTNEQRLIQQTVRDYVQNEVLPVLDRLEQKDWALARQLLLRAAALGLLGVDAPEDYDGLHLDKVTSMVVAEQIAWSGSFGATFGAQANLTVLPLVLFGTEAQKKRYLPGLVAGTTVGAYCLSEPGSGSDALGAKTRATTQADGSFVLNGEKMWITNGGIADVFIVFAKVDGELFTAFIVERAFAGVSNGKEEHKMGLHGSSTTPVILQDVRVPAENLLGEIGKGHKIAFNVLNFARFKLGAMCVGSARAAIGEAAKYAGTRRQFGQPIGTFGAIAHKIGEMISWAYAVESLTYRTAGLIDQRLADAESGNEAAAALAVFEDYAVEASIAKVAGSEMLDYVLDENIQIHGGNGYVRDYPAERHYRDSRVNRIFEGTNEINRLLIPGLLARRAAKGEIALIAAAKSLQDELMSPTPMTPGDGSPLAEETRSTDAFKKVAILGLGLAMQTYREKIGEQQEVLMQIADICIDTYAAESAVLRARAAGGARAALHHAAARVFVSEAAIRIEAASRRALGIMLEGDTLRMTMTALKRLFRQMPINGAALRRQLSDEAIAKGRWVF